MTKQGTVLIVA